MILLATSPETESILSTPVEEDGDLGSRRHLIDVCYRRSLDEFVRESRRFNARNIPVDLDWGARSLPDCRCMVGTMTLTSNVSIEKVEGLMRLRNARMLDTHQAFAYLEQFGDHPKFAGRILYTGILCRSERLGIEHSLTFRVCPDGSVLTDLDPSESCRPGSMFLVHYPYQS
jgi:hypothetical protein